MNTSKACLREAKEAFEEANFALCVRRSQECIELSIKAVLRALSIEFPKEHDVSEAITDLETFDLPDWFKEKLPKLSAIMREITPKRGPALYGFEKELRPPSRIFSETDGLDSIERAKEVFEVSDKFLKEWFI